MFPSSNNMITCSKDAVSLPKQPTKKAMLKQQINASPSMSSQQTFSQNFAQRQEIVNNLILNDIIGKLPKHRPRKTAFVTASSKTSPHNKFVHTSVSTAAKHAEPANKWVTLDNAGVPVKAIGALSPLRSRKNSRSPARQG